MKTLEIKNINKTYDGDNLVLKDINLAIEEGQFCVLVGPSGCGKSTLLKIIAGLESTSSGKVLIGDKDHTNSHPKERNIGMVFQNYALYPHMTVRENLAFPLKVQKVTKSTIPKQVDVIANEVDIYDLLDRLPKQLSGGQRQRVALGRALIKSPDIYLFDEPLSNLDAKLRNSLRQGIIKLHKSTKKTSVYVTHDQTEAMTMADIIVVLNDGIIQQMDTPSNIYKYPKNLFVAKFIGSPEMNIISSSNFDIFSRSEILIPPNAEYIGIRPEDLSITDDNADIITNSVYFEELGFERIYHLEVLDLKVRSTKMINELKNINIKINIENIHFFNTKGERVN